MGSAFDGPKTVVLRGLGYGDRSMVDSPKQEDADG